jgi:tetraacyldisaccharide-1-P 4'-kinase
VKSWGLAVVGQKVFRDHHSYTARDVGILEDQAQQAGAKALLTTEKDTQNLKGLHFSRVPLYCCRIALEIRDDKRLSALLSEKLSSRAGFVA